MTEQHTPTPHPFAKEITEWLKDTSQPLMYVVKGSDRWYSGTANNGPSRILETIGELAGVHVGNNPPPKEAVCFDLKHYTINAPIKDIKEAEGNQIFIVDLHQSTGVLTLEDSDIHFLEECFKRGFVYLNHEDALMKAKHLMDKIGLGLAM